MTPPRVQVRDHTVEMLSGSSARPLVQSLDLVVSPGQTLAIIGESGSGKSVATTARARPCWLSRKPTPHARR